MRRLFTLLLLGVLGLTACSDQTKAAYGGDVALGALPADVCIQGGRPLVLSVSIENEGDIDLAYINTSGELIVQKYGMGAIGLTTAPQGKLIWTGGRC